MGEVKNEREKRVSTLYVFWKSPHLEGEGLVTVGGGVTIMAVLLFAPQGSEAAARAQSPIIWRTGLFYVPQVL